MGGGGGAGLFAGTVGALASKVPSSGKLLAIAGKSARPVPRQPHARPKSAKLSDGCLASWITGCSCQRITRKKYAIRGN